MRLIDADAMYDKFVRNSSIYDTTDLPEILKDMPTIDAIPVEWLEEHDSWGNEYGRWYITVVEALSMWQKEQEVHSA